MTKHNQIIDKLSSRYESDESIYALLVTGSVARDEETVTSDLDLLLVSKEKQPFYEEIIDGITVEIKTNNLDGFIQKMKDDPMNVYQWLDAKVVFDKENMSEKIINEAKNMYDSYSPDPKEIAGVKKWLESAKIKIETSENSKDNLALGFNISNNIWQIVKGLYLLNNKPVPPSTTAYKRIDTLEALPTEFRSLWKGYLVGNLKERCISAVELIEFILAKL